MKSAISQPFSVTASKEPISVKSIARYYLTEASGTTPSANDSRWKLVNEGEAVPMPTSAAPYLWKKTVTTFTDGTSSTAIEFAGSLGKNGIDYDLVPSHSSIVKAEDGTLSPANVTCKIIKRNADGTAEQLSSVPTGYSIAVYRDSTAVSSAYTPGSNVSTSGTTTSISFVLKYGSVEVERHSLNVIAEGGQGIDGRGIQSQDYRFRAHTATFTPKTPENDNEWNEWQALEQCGYSAAYPYLWRCCKTVYVDGNGNTDTEYVKDGPTVWGQNGADAIYLDLDNQMDSISVGSSGAMSQAQSFTIHATLYKGASPVTGGITAPTESAIALNGCTPTVTTNGGVVTITYSFTKIPTIFEDRHYTVDIPLVYGGRTYTATFTLAPVRSGANAFIYNVHPSMDVCSFARNSDNSVSPSSYSVTCGCVLNNGSNTITYTNVTGNIGGTWHIFYRKRQNGSWDNSWTYYNGAITITPSHQAIEFCIAKTTTAASVTDSIIVDREVVPVLVGGTNGANGKNAFVVDLDNEMDAIPCNSVNYLSSARTYNLNIGAFYGTTEVNLNTCSADISPNNAGISVSFSNDNPKTPVVNVPAGYYHSATYEITFTCSHTSYGTRSVIFTLVVQKSGAPGVSPTIYQLAPTATSLVYSRDANGNLTGTKIINCKIRKIYNDNTEEFDVGQTVHKVKYGYNDADPAPQNFSDGEMGLPASIVEQQGYYNMVFELYYGSTRIDRETIPIIKDGKKGEDGEGEEGNGISSVTYFRMFTMAFVAPLASNSGWIVSSDEDYPNESGLSKENRYLWQLKKTTYTKDTSIDYEVSLFAQYESGVCANLLEDTAFNDINDMDAWNIKDGKVVEQAHENQNGFEVTTDDEREYRDVLRQTVYLSKELKKLETNTWYTLSFYGMMDGYQTIHHGAAKSNNVAPYYMVQYEKDHIYVDPGQTISVYVVGWVASTSVYMRYFCWRQNNDGSWAQSSYVTFSTTSPASKSITFTNNSSNTAKIYMRGYVYNSDGTQNSSSETSHRGYIQSVYVTRGSALDTYIYRSDFGKAVIADTSAPWICDGNVVNTAKYLSDSDTTKQYLGTYAYFTTNGHIRWQMTDAVLRHSFTFKTPSSLAEDVSYYVLFRASTYAHPGWISKPKLERNTMATEWIEHTNDRMAADFQHIYAGEWSASTAYMYANGVRHVVRAKKSANGEMTYFRLKKRTSASGYKNSTEPYIDTEYWEEASYLKFVATDLMLANEAIIGFAKTNRIEVYNSAGNVAAGMGGAVNGDNDFPLWIGASYGSRANAPFRVTLAGKMYATGCEISGNSTFSGTLKGVTGTFRQLQAIDSGGAVKAEIGFNSSEGKLYFSGDMQHQGYDNENNRSYRFLTSDLWCRGVFGARERSCMVVYGSYAYVYLKGFENNNSGTYISLTSTTINSKTTYILPCYSPRSDYAAATAGFPVDVIILRQTTVQYYKLSMALSQRVLVFNGNDNISAYIIQKGNWIEWHGGEVAEVFQSPTSILNPTPTGEGAGQIIGAFRDNNWS